MLPNIMFCIPSLDSQEPNDVSMEAPFSDGGEETLVLRGTEKEFYLPLVNGSSQTTQCVCVCVKNLSHYF